MLVGEHEERCCIQPWLPECCGGSGADQGGGHQGQGEAASDAMGTPEPNRVRTCWRERELILGLSLLGLLVQDRIAEFHTELELLPPSALENPCIKHVVELEQSFMEGAYNRVLSVTLTVPHETYVYFIDLLAKTIRDEIAGCSEKAYDYLSINDAKKILMFSSDHELSEYITEIGHDKQGLPIGLQLIGHSWGEASILQVVSAVEVAGQKRGSQIMMPL